MIGESFIGQYRLSNRLRHSILAVLSVLIVGALALAALSLRDPAATDDSVRAGVSLPDPLPGTADRDSGTLTASTESGSVSRFDPSGPSVSTSVTAEEATRRPPSTAAARTTLPPEPEPTPSSEPEPEPEPTPPTEPEPDPDPDPTPTPTSKPDPDPTQTITIITLPDPTWITLPWPTHTLTLPTHTIPEPTVETTWDQTTVTGETTIPTTWDITLPTLPPESRPRPRPGR